MQDKSGDVCGEEFSAPAMLSLVGSYRATWSNQSLRSSGYLPVDSVLSTHDDACATDSDKLAVAENDGVQPLACSRCPCSPLGPIVQGEDSSLLADRDEHFISMTDAPKVASSNRSLVS